eukprot:Colp12_sorted_trinity150504_noHs@12530
MHDASNPFDDENTTLTPRSGGSSPRPVVTDVTDDLVAQGMHVNMYGLEMALPDRPVQEPTVELVVEELTGDEEAWPSTTTRVQPVPALHSHALEVMKERGDSLLDDFAEMERMAEQSLHSTN